jgi:glycosyltransferase involved in cell wall biosynthesis
LGFLEGLEKNRVILNSDVLIFPSYSEGLPATVLEAMSAGLCVVSTPVGGLSDILIDGHNSIILDFPPDKENIIESLSKLLNNKEILNNIRKINYLESRRNYDSRIVSTKLDKVYSKLLTI